MSTHHSADRVAASLALPVREARHLAEKVGLDPYPVKFWIVDHDEMNQVMAYEGFQERYPHWRWGMQYDQRRKADRYRAGKAFEIVNHDNPAHAFLQESNAHADQKAVITHVLGHADFFKRNEFFQTIGTDEPGAAAMVARHARRIRGYMDDPDVERDEVERWIDHVLCLTDTIDQHRSYAYRHREAASTTEETRSAAASDEEPPELGVRDEVREAVFDDEWLEERRDDGGADPSPEADVLAFLSTHGKQYDQETGRATEMEEWQREIIEMLRAEAYYFAPQRMTKVMNEGWGAYYESLMMAGEGFADDDEIVTYADHLSKVLGSEGLNPYALGMELWEYVENRANRREVLERLLRVEGITWRTLHEAVDFEAVREALAPPEPLDRISPDRLDALADVDDHYVDRAAPARARAGEIDVDRCPWKVLTYEGLARRNFSLVRPRHRGFLERVEDDELERIDRYLGDAARYPDLEAAIAEVDYTAGWERMQEVRENHYDVTFLETFLTPEFLREGEYFTYEYSHADRQFRVASQDYEDVKEKLLLQFTNFGKPRITVLDGNYQNRNELLLGHHYNGIMLDLKAAERTLERVFALWGRPVNLKTVVKTEDGDPTGPAPGTAEDPDIEEVGLLLRYDGETIESSELAWADVEELADGSSRYDTTPAEWYA